MGTIEKDKESEPKGDSLQFSCTQTFLQEQFLSSLTYLKRALQKIIIEMKLHKTRDLEDQSGKHVRVQ